MKNLSPHTYWVLYQPQGLYSQVWKKIYYTGFFWRFVCVSLWSSDWKICRETWLTGRKILFCIAPMVVNTLCALTRWFFVTSLLMLTPPGILRVRGIALLLTPGIPKGLSFGRDFNSHGLAGIPSLMYGSSFCALWSFWAFSRYIRREHKLLSEE